MTKTEAIALFKEIQNGRGTGDLREEFRREFRVGDVANKLWDDPEFTLGIEYGILIALQQVFDLDKFQMKHPFGRPVLMGDEQSAGLCDQDIRVIKFNCLGGGPQTIEEVMSILKGIDPKRLREADEVRFYTNPKDFDTFDLDDLLERKPVDRADESGSSIAINPEVGVRRRKKGDIERMKHPFGEPPKPK